MKYVDMDRVPNRNNFESYGKRLQWDRTNSSVGKDIQAGATSVTKSMNATSFQYPKPEYHPNPVISRGTINKVVSKVSLGDEHEQNQWSVSSLKDPGTVYGRMPLPDRTASNVQFGRVPHRDFLTTTQSAFQSNSMYKPEVTVRHPQWRYRPASPKLFPQRERGVKFPSTTTGSVHCDLTSQAERFQHFSKIHTLNRSLERPAVADPNVKAESAPAINAPMDYPSNNTLVTRGTVNKCASVVRLVGDETQHNPDNAFISTNVDHYKNPYYKRTTEQKTTFCQEMTKSRWQPGGALPQFTTSSGDAFSPPRGRKGKKMGHPVGARHAFQVTNSQVELGEDMAFTPMPHSVSTHSPQVAFSGSLDRGAFLPKGTINKYSSQILFNNSEIDHANYFNYHNY